MKLDDLSTTNQPTAFLSGARAVAFSIINNKDKYYHWIQAVRVKPHSPTLPQADKGIVIRY